MAASEIYDYVSTVTPTVDQILDIEPQELHQRVPYFVGSRKMVEKAEEFIKEFGD